jgi:hypothetical protein
MKDIINAAQLIAALMMASGKMTSSTI